MVVEIVAMIQASSALDWQDSPVYRMRRGGA
jgi:hypothetical protein